MQLKFVPPRGVNGPARTVRVPSVAGTRRQPRRRVSWRVLPRGACVRDGRAGFVMQEAVLALGVAIVVIVGVAQLLAAVSRQCRLAQQRAVVVQEAGNVLEDLMSRTWEQITEEQLAAVKLSEDCRRWLPDAALRVELNSEDEDTKRISVHIDWQPAAGQPGRAVGVSGWKVRAEEVRP